MRARLAKGALVSPVHLSLCVNDIPTLSLHSLRGRHGSRGHVFRSPPLLTGYLEAYFCRLELWLRNWKIGINASKITIALSVKSPRRLQTPTPMKLLGEPMEWVVTARYLGMTLHTQLT